MARALFPLLVILLGFSHLVSLNAAPVTRLGRLMHGHEALPLPKNTHMVAEERIMKEGTIEGRMSMELNDYPGSGANNRHTPRPQFGRCADC